MLLAEVMRHPPWDMTVDCSVSETENKVRPYIAVSLLLAQ